MNATGSVPMPLSQSVPENVHQLSSVARLAPGTGTSAREHGAAARRAINTPSLAMAPATYLAKVLFAFIDLNRANAPFILNYKHWHLYLSTLIRI